MERNIQKYTKTQTYINNYLDAVKSFQIQHILCRKRNFISKQNDVPSARQYQVLLIAQPVQEDLEESRLAN